MQPVGPHDAGQGHHPTGPVGTPSTGAGRASRVHLGDLLAGVGGLLLFLFSFAPFVEYPDRFVADVNEASDRNFDGWYMAWSTQMFMAPLTWWVVISGLILLALAAIRTLTGRDVRLLGFGGAQLMVGLSLFAFFVLLGYTLSHKQILFGLDNVADEVPEFFGTRPSIGWGGAFMLLSSIIAVVGAVLAHLNVGPSFPLAARRPHQASPGGPVGPPNYVDPGYPQGGYPQGGYPPNQEYPPAPGYGQAQAPGYPPQQQPGWTYPQQEPPPR